MYDRKTALSQAPNDEFSSSKDPAFDPGSNAEQQQQLDGNAAEVPSGESSRNLPTALLTRVPPDASEEEWSYLTLGYAAFLATVRRDPTLEEFDAVLARWEAGEGALAEVSAWIDAIGVLEAAFPTKDDKATPTLPAEQLDALRDEIVKLPPALQGPYYLKCQAAAAYENERDNVMNYTENVDTRVWNKDTDSMDIQHHTKGENHESSGGGTCNLSSTAMALRGMGYDTSPEALFEEVDKNAELYPQMGDAVEQATDGAYVLWQLTAEDKPAFWTDVVQGLLAHGYGTMLHVPGHVVRLEAVEPDGLRVDDPYGKEDFVGGNRRPLEGNSKNNPDAGEDNLWPFAAPDDLQFIAPDPLPDDVAGKATRKGNTVTATDGLLAGRHVTKR